MTASRRIITRAVESLRVATRLGALVWIVSGCSIRQPVLPVHIVPGPVGNEIPSIPQRRPDRTTRVCDIAAFDMAEGSGRDVGSVVQECISLARPGDVVTLPPGKYRIDRQIVIDRPLWLTSGDLGPSDPPCRSEDTRCAELVAGEDFHEKFGLLTTARGTKRVVIDHVIFNGNKDERQDSRAAEICRRGGNNNKHGYNVGLQSCIDCWFLNSVSRNALCGTALEVVSTNVAFSRFEDNGLHKRYLWADGLTAKECPGKFVYQNYFARNTDVDCVVGTGPCDVIGNRIVHEPKFRTSSFAAINLFTFFRHEAPHAGTRVAKNTIDCGDRRGCGAAIHMGSDAWAPGGSRRPVAGPVYVYDNYIQGAQGGILIDTGNDIRLSRNVIHATGGRYHAGCGDRDFPLASRSEQSTITSTEEVFPYEVIEWEYCVPNHDF